MIRIASIDSLPLDSIIDSMLSAQTTEALQQFGRVCPSELYAWAVLGQSRDAKFGGDVG